MQWIEGAPAPAELPVPDGDLWIFGYGSLMWDPAFPHAAILPAAVDGWHRSFCVRSMRHRGTPERPGLVVGLSQGGTSCGLAIKAAATHKASILDYLWQREMVLADGYRPEHVTARLDDGTGHDALAFVADSTHEAYFGELPTALAAERIAAAHGQRGSNREYLERTLAHLHELGIVDPGLEELGRAVAAIGA